MLGPERRPGQALEPDRPDLALAAADLLSADDRYDLAAPWTMYVGR